MKKSCSIGCAICIGAFIAFLVVGTVRGDWARAHLDVTVSDLVAAAQHPAKRRESPADEACARELNRLLDGKAVKWHRITDRTVQFFGYSVQAVVELGLSDGSRLYVRVLTNGSECKMVQVEDPTTRQQ